MAPEIPSRARPIRDRLLDAAGSLFYREGIRAVSADKIIAAAGTTKVTFYRYFPTKDDLVAAYLDEQSRRIREAAGLLPEDPCEALTALAAAMGQEACRPGFRGCPFINAAAEYPDPRHPVRAAVDRHRTWFHALVTSLVAALGAAEPEAAADQLLMLRDGAMVHGYVSEPGSVGAGMLQAGRAVLQLHVRPGSTG
ncbi:TetR/AcrR family transcriptional regulator [Arthrobacter sp. Sa2CUA1]|uniref:TetR/AcrR family transcriptional regulator n=1 Tax=Arthrobacter gallicola TaxID=2762225 RepID=A0ABR8UT26_9MICC|nr:TetR/AcrR family transcriptional regulator [Arthrobacter gallicola]MBD7995707.1 TetR/AcrR family transcriptional regulator [Arthrobacter gallicola]